MSTDFTNLRGVIRTQLESISEIATVYDYHTDNLDGFPAATFEPSRNDAVQYSNTDNLRDYAFDIYIHQEMENVGRDRAIEILCAAVDAVLTSFDENYTLNGACDLLLALPSTWGEYTGGNGAVKYAQLTVVARREVNVTSGI